MNIKNWVARRLMKQLSAKVIGDLNLRLFPVYVSEIHGSVACRSARDEAL